MVSFTEGAQMCWLGREPDSAILRVEWVYDKLNLGLRVYIKR